MALQYIDISSYRGINKATILYLGQISTIQVFESSARRCWNLASY